MVGGGFFERNRKRFTCWFRDFTGRKNSTMTQLTKIPVVVLYSIAFLLATTSLVLSASGPPPVGGTLPSFKLAIPEDAETRSYLGLADDSHFTVSQIKAEVVIIEIFNMY
jgi:hypothetical protein